MGIRRTALEHRSPAQFCQVLAAPVRRQNKTPTLVITNELDFRVPVDHGLQLFTALRRNSVRAEALVFPDEGHWVLGALNSKRWHEAVFNWMKQYLSP